jgi:hypothetical protein
MDLAAVARVPGVRWWAGLSRLPAGGRVAPGARDEVIHRRLLASAAPAGRSPARRTARTGLHSRTDSEAGVEQVALGVPSVSEFESAFRNAPASHSAVGQSPTVLLQRVVGGLTCGIHRAGGEQRHGRAAHDRVLLACGTARKTQRHEIRNSSHRAPFVRASIARSPAPELDNGFSGSTTRQ